MTDEHVTQMTNASARHGKIIVIISLASILIWILLSEGYNPSFNFLANLLYSMKISFFKICEFSYYDGRTCNPFFSFMTKNLILFSFMVGMYGSLIWQGLTTSPATYLQSYIAKRKGRNQPTFSDQIPSLTIKAEEIEVLPENSYSKEEVPKIKAPEAFNSKKEEDLFLKVAIIAPVVSIFLIILIFLLNIGNTP